MVSVGICIKEPSLSWCWPTDHKCRQ